MDRKTIVVCGATGNQGGAVIQALLDAQKWNVTALSRNPGSERAQALSSNGVEVRKADLEDKASLAQAFRNAYGVFGVTQPFSPDYKKCNVAAETQQGRNIVDACLEAGVKHLVHSTVMHLGMEKTGMPHVDSKIVIEQYAVRSGVPNTLLRPASFMDNIGTPFFPVKKGLVRGFVDRDARVPYVSCHDIGIFAAIAFEHPEEYLGKAVDVMGDFVSGEDLCAILSKLRGGERFKYKAVPRLLMRIFAREFYSMRVTFEKWGRPPYPKEFPEAQTSCRKMYPKMMSVEDYLRFRGYDTRSL
ncbi:MAG: NmrA/HSCARG family protein [Chloroflexi bacterium]|nr:NmrA/HSCARG family protein [Chloroflexota bacterium]